MRRAALFLLPLAAACGDEPDRGYAATAAGARQEPYAAVPAGTAPRGTGARGAEIASPGPPITPTLIAAGADTWQGYCAPCHGLSGRGDGPVTDKGFPRPPPLAPGAHSPEEIVAIIGDGRGRMPPLAEQVPPLRRWAVAYYLTREGRRAE